MSFILQGKVLVMDTPKRASSTFRVFCKENRLSIQDLGERTHDSVDHPGVPLLLFMRHPATWMRSLWSHRKRRCFDWSFESPLERSLIRSHGDEFLREWEGFCEALLSHENMVEDLDRYYLRGISVIRPIHVIKVESFDEGLEKFLRRTDLWRSGMRRSKIRNASKDLPEFPEGFLDQLMEKNWPFYHRSDYGAMP